MCSLGSGSVVIGGSLPPVVCGAQCIFLSVVNITVYRSPVLSVVAIKLPAASIDPYPSGSRALLFASSNLNMS